MKHAYHFLTEWQTTSTTGEKIEQLTRANAELISSTYIKGAQFESQTLENLLEKIKEQTMESSGTKINMETVLNELKQRIVDLTEGKKQGAENGNNTP